MWLTDEGGAFPPEPRSRLLRLLGILCMIGGTALFILAGFIDPLAWADEFPGLVEIAIGAAGLGLVVVGYRWWKGKWFDLSNLPNSSGGA